MWFNFITGKDKPEELAVNVTPESAVQAQINAHRTRRALNATDPSDTKAWAKAYRANETAQKRAYDLPNKLGAADFELYLQLLTKAFAK